MSRQSLAPLARLLAGAALIAFPVSTYAQSSDHGNAEGEPHDVDEIVVIGHAMGQLGIMSGSLAMDQDKVVANMSPQIGDLVASLPGVSATGFAPGASRPVLRGLTGDRVLVLTDGLGSIDASSVSADHGVALDTLTIDHIDVLHGPALLAFGGQAIGGAVNAADKRIPRRRPTDGFDLTALASYDTVADRKSLGASAEVQLGERWVGHVDASWHRGGDLRIGGNAVSAPLRAELATLGANLDAEGDADGAAAVRDAAAQRGRVPNTFARGSSFGGGIAFLDAGGSLGLSASRLTTRYGIPARPGPEAEHVYIALKQTRFDMRGHVDVGGLVDSIQLRGAYGDYEHSEIEDTGEVGTTFARKAIETRLELVQDKRGGWSGRSGIQFGTGSLSAVGEEAILPANKDSRIGVFTIQSLETGRFVIELAGRAERVNIKANPIGFERSFTLRSGAAGLAFKPVEGVKLGINWSHGERAPSVEELLTEGVHPATQSYEIGNPNFGIEHAKGLEAYIKVDLGDTVFNLTAYRTRFKGFITPLPTGAIQEDVPVYEYRQLPARFTGMEAQLTQVLVDNGTMKLTADATADYVHATLIGMGPAPLIPPLRIQGGLELETGDFGFRSEVEWNDKQTRVGAFANPTESFTLVNAQLSWTPMGKDGPLMLMLSGDNLFDVVGRRAASLTRDFMPIAGRSVRLTAKVSF